MDSELEKILRMVHNIYDDQTSKIIFYELYSSIYSHVTNNKEKILYERICQIIEQKTKQHATFLTFLQEETILETFNEKWKHHLSKMKILSKVFTFLENHCLVPNQKLILFQVGTKFWKQYIFESESAQESKVLSKLTQSLMDNISKSRIGDTIDQTLMKNVISMYIEISEGLDFYQMWFERIFLQTSKNYFRITSQELLSTNQCGSYLIKIKKLFRFELQIICNFLDFSTREKLIELMYDEYLRNHLETLKYMESGPIMMLKKFQTEELHVVYTFFTAIGEKEWLLECLFTGFSKLGNQILDKFENNTKDLQNYYTIKELISLRKGCIKLLINSFENDQDFYHKIDQCFFKFINNNDQSSQVAKNLPKFMDYEIRYLKKKTENEIEELFEYFIQIFKFVSEKDVFKKYYEFFLSRRLVSSYNIDEEIEKKIILKLKLNSWSNFTLKMEDMIKNVQASKENYLEFQKYQKTAMSGENIIHIMPWIVKQSIWPVSLKINCILPKMLSNNLNVFNEFYQKQHSGHILKWQFNVGSSEMIFSLYSVTPITPSTKSPLPIFKTGKAIKEKKYNFKNYLLIVSPFQMIILLQFNSLLKDSPPTYSFQELIQLTGIPEKTMKITLSGLCTKKYPILKRISYSKDNIQEFKYTINLKFKNSQRRFKLMKISQNYSETNKNVNMHWVKKEREVLLESMIMKIMKSRRVIKHKELIFELTKLLKDKFIPSITMIKQRTNNLIDREYIEKDVNLYRYLA